MIIGGDKIMPLMGVITSEICSTCGHHEVGISTADGVFHPLRPGMWVQTLEAPPFKSPGTRQPDVTPDEEPLLQPEVGYRPWIPDVLRGNSFLRLKYGVMIQEDMVFEEVRGEIYQAAYLRKLESLVDKEISADVVVMLDRFFAAPQLASGNSSNITLNLWREIEEIREPVRLMNRWLADPSEKNFLDLIHPKSVGDIEEPATGNSNLEEELKQLTLEQFLSLL